MKTLLAALVLGFVFVPLPPSRPEIGCMHRAACGGKYRGLVRVLKCPTDASVGDQDFLDYGWWDPCEPREWCGHKDIPAGYWVYVWPWWFVWGDQLTP